MDKRISLKIEITLDEELSEEIRQAYGRSGLDALAEAFAQMMLECGVYGHIRRNMESYERFRRETNHEGKGRNHLSIE